MIYNEQDEINYWIFPVTVACFIVFVGFSFFFFLGFLVVHFLDALLLSSVIPWYYELLTVFVIAFIAALVIVEKPEYWLVYYFGTTVSLERPRLRNKNDHNNWYYERDHWIKNNIRGPHIKTDHLIYRFLYKSDAIAFKLMWI